jgi:formate-nitrite transporter family protein
MTAPDAPAPKEVAQRPYQQILLNELGTGLAEFRRPTVGLFLSSLSGGLDVSFSLLLMATIHTLVGGGVSSAAARLWVANMYSVGFIFIVVGRSELFTEHTSRAMFPVLAGQASWAALARLWALVYVGNLVGIVAFTAMVVYTGPPLGIIEPSSFTAMARPLVEREWWLALVSAGLAGWLMGLLSWLVSACRDTISQIVIVWLVATSIGLVRLPHAIVGAGEVLSDVFAGQTTCHEFARFLALTTLGNGLGGAIFVAVLKYGHTTRGGEKA